jgi:antitoxin FitA
MVAFRYARFIMPAAITLKGIPDDLYDRLKRSAKAHHRSLNSEVIACLERQLAPQALSVDERLARARTARRPGRLEVRPGADRRSDSRRPCVIVVGSNNVQRCRPRRSPRSAVEHAHDVCPAEVIAFE